MKSTTLLEQLAESAGCSYLSELHDIKGASLQKLIQKWGSVSSLDFPLKEWNDALIYLISAPPQPTPAAARQCLLDHYHNQEESPLSESPQGGMSV